jgi:hypothetical protein
VIERLIMQGAISELPRKQRSKVSAAAKKLRAIVDEYGETGFAALVLVCAERVEAEESAAKAGKA